MAYKNPHSIDLGANYPLGPRPINGEYDWDTILDETQRFYIAGEHFMCQIRNFPSMCRQQAEKRGIGVDLYKFVGLSFDPIYGKNGVIVKAVPSPNRHKKRVALGGIGNGGGTPRRRGGYSAKSRKKAMDPNKHKGQFLRP